MGKRKRKEGRGKEAEEIRGGQKSEERKKKGIKKE